MKATLGRIVHYVPPPTWAGQVSRPDRELAAIITQGAADDDITMAVELTVFNVFPGSPESVFSVPFSEERVPHSWHWPERV